MEERRPDTTKTLIFCLTTESQRQEQWMTPAFFETAFIFKWFLLHNVQFLKWFRPFLLCGEKTLFCVLFELCGVSKLADLNCAGITVVYPFIHTHPDVSVYAGVNTHLHVNANAGVNTHPHVNVNAGVNAHLGIHLTLVEVLYLRSAVQVKPPQHATAPRDGFLWAETREIHAFGM